MKHFFGKSFFTLSVTTLALASVILLTPEKAFADVGQYLYTDVKTGVDGQFDARLGTGGSGNATSFTFYTTDVSAATGGWSGGFATLTECDNNATDEGSGTCTNRVRNDVSSGSINAVGNFVTITFPSAITLNPAKYYIFAYYLGSGSFDDGSIYGINTGTCYGTVSFLGTSCTLGLTQVYWDLQGSATGLSFGTSITPDTTTRIIDFFPYDSTIVTGPTIDFGLDYYIDETDLFIDDLKIKIELRNIDQNVLLLGFLSPGTFNLLDIVATSSGLFEFRDSRALADGNYRLRACLSRSYTYFGFIPDPFKSNETCISHQFIVGESTFIGSISQNSFAQLNSIFASSTATSTASLALSCVPFSETGFDTIKCLSFLFIPDSGYLNDTITAFKDKVAQNFPLGYVTHFLSILTATSTADLVVINATVPPGVVGSGATVYLSLNGVLDPILNATSSSFISGNATSTDSFYDITAGYWKTIVYILTLFYIITRVLGSHLLPRFGNRIN